MIKFKLIFIVGCIVITLCGCSKPNVSGQWSGRITNDNTGISIDKFDVLINQEDNKLTGNITILIKDYVWQTSLTGVIDKNNIVFNSENKGGLYAIFNGLIDRNIITGNSDIIMQGTREGTVRESFKFILNKVKLSASYSKNSTPVQAKDTNPEWTAKRELLCEESLPGVKTGVTLGKALMSKRALIASGPQKLVGSNDSAVVVETYLINYYYDGNQGDAIAVAGCSDALLQFDPDGSKSQNWINALASKGIK